MHLGNGSKASRKPPGVEEIGPVDVVRNVLNGIVKSLWHDQREKRSACAC